MNPSKRSTGHYLILSCSFSLSFSQARQYGRSPYLTKIPILSLRRTPLRQALLLTSRCSLRAMRDSLNMCPAILISAQSIMFFRRRSDLRSECTALISRAFLRSLIRHRLRQKQFRTRCSRSMKFRLSKSALRMSMTLMT